MDICVYASEPVAYSFEDEKGKKVEGKSPKICVGEFVDGECVSLTVVKASPEFASNCCDRIGEILPNTAIAYDRFKRAAFFVQETPKKK